MGKHLSVIGETQLQWEAARVRTVTHSDISPELVVETLARVETHASGLDTRPQRNTLPWRFRKRLAGVKGA